MKRGGLWPGNQDSDNMQFLHDLPILTAMPPRRPPFVQIR